MIYLLELEDNCQRISTGEIFSERIFQMKFSGHLSFAFESCERTFGFHVSSFNIKDWLVERATYQKMFGSGQSVKHSDWENFNARKEQTFVAKKE